MSKIKQGILTSYDIMKGYTGLPSGINTWATQPLQAIPLAEKTEDWKKWNADWFENIALKHLPKKSEKLQRLYNLAAGIINKSDYIYNPDNEDNEFLSAIKATDEEASLLDQFFPIIPNIIQVFLGEIIKRDKTVIIQAKDPESTSEALEYKETLVKEILENFYLERKKIELIKRGLMPGQLDENGQDIFQLELETAAKLSEAENKFKKFRTIAEQWSQKFVELFGTRNYFSETELWAFADSLIADEAIIALILREEDFEPIRLSPKNTYVNISPNERYYSNANFIVNIEFMSLPDIINLKRGELKTEQIERLEKQYYDSMGQNILMPDQYGNSSSYYDITKTYDDNQRISAGMTEEMSARIVANFLNGNSNTRSFHEQFKDFNLIRFTRIWWASQRRIGLLTKIVDGNPEPIIEQIDENFVVTEKPEYDNSLTKEKTADNLIRGEHVDWKYTVEWRYIEKIGNNIPEYTKPNDKNDGPIYLGGDPIKFQFKGKDSIYNAAPPIQGCRFSNLENKSLSIVERQKPWQIVYNVLGNRAIKLLPLDIGKVLVAGKSTVKANSLLQEDGLEPVFEMMKSVRDTNTIIVDDSIDAQRERGNNSPLMQVVDMTSIDQISTTLQVAQFVKMQAYESIGFSPQRMAKIGQRETATGVIQGKEASENQTEMHFELFCTNFIPRVWQMIVEAGQYYATLSENFADSYLTNDAERVFFQVNDSKALLRDLHVTAQSNADVRNLMKTMEQLILNDNTMGATFVDKVKALSTKSPSKIIEDLQKAQDKMQQMEESKQQQINAIEENKLKAAAEEKERQRAFEMEKLDKTLENQRYLKELELGFRLTEDNSADIERNNIENKKVDAGILSEQSTIDLENRKQAFKEKQHEDEMALKYEQNKMKEKEIKSKENIAIQNKQPADVKFKQLKK